MRYIYLEILILISRLISINSNDTDQITAWTNEIGEKLWKLGQAVTESVELKKEYSNVNVIELNFKELIKEMAEQASLMIDGKLFALKRIADVAEKCTKRMADATEKCRKLTTAEIDETCSKNLTDNSNRKVRKTWKYIFRDAKDNDTFLDSDYAEMNKGPLFFNKNASIEFSTVHVPDDVYIKDNETLVEIKCGEMFDEVFRNNYWNDSNPSWQYFAGTSGLMRIFPGFQWQYDAMDDRYEKDNMAADLYDARKRPWYIGASTDPKDIIILVDNSGSMTGVKRKVGRHTINTIIESLGDNDFFNIISYTTKSKFAIRCFNETLVQANTITTREFKFGVENMIPPTHVTDLYKALKEALGFLEKHRRKQQASMCDQAIMLVTDDILDNFTDLFRNCDWNSTDHPFPVKVFTYLIGKDGADFNESKWVPCANKGYYVELNTPPEVKEKVLNYTNILSQYRTSTKSRKVAWTSLYASQVDPKRTDRYWLRQQDDMQKRYTIEYMKNWEYFLRPKNQLARLKEKRKLELDQNRNYGYDEHNLMVTASLPVYDEKLTEDHTATLLGVAATDISVTEFKQIMNPHILGVNNYGFIVNNDGHVLTHPDLRPMLGDVLKPGYNVVDMLEVEQLYSASNTEPREFAAQINPLSQKEPALSLNTLPFLRDHVINQTDYWDLHLVKYHYDNMKRASVGARSYTVKKIGDSPFTMVLTHMKQPCKNFPNCLPYRISAPQEKLSPEEVSGLFSGNWTIHPEWFYCQYFYKNKYFESYSDDYIKDKKTELIHFLKKMYNKQSNYLQYFSKNRYAKFTDDTTSKPRTSMILTYSCDQELIHNVIYDAYIINKTYSQRLKDINAPTYFDFNFNIANMFISTHSGLTRWYDFHSNKFTPFGWIHNRSIDEIWYKRAIEQHYFNEESFMFSVPFEDDETPIELESQPERENRTILMTASHAIFVKDKKRGKSEGGEAPVAVVGFQFEHGDLEDFIKNVVNDGQDQLNGEKGEIDYVVLDNNAYIVAANKKGYAGQFFGTIQSNMMKQMKECNIFKQIVTYDYQGVCFYPITSNSAISTLINPFIQVSNFVTWTLFSLLYGIVKVNFELITSIMWFTSTIKSEPVISDSPYMSIEDVPVLEDRLDAVLNDTFQYAEFLRKVPDTNELEIPKYVEVKHLVKINRTKPYTCDRKTILYSLEPFSLWNHQLTSCVDIIRSVRIIPHTNLIFVLLKHGFEEKKINYEYFTTYPTMLIPKNKLYRNSSVCQKTLESLSRRRPSFCVKHHKNVFDSD